MRNLIICTLLVALAYWGQAGPDPLVQPVTFLGILFVISILGSRLFRNSRLLAPVGAIVAGFLIGPTGLVGDSALQNIDSFLQFGFVWIGLFLGATCARPITMNLRSLTASAAPLIGCSLTGCLLFPVFFPLTLLEALRVGLTAATAAPIFVLMTAPGRREPLAHATLVTALALLLLLVTTVREAPTSLPDRSKVFTLGASLLLLEVSFRICRKLMTESGRSVFFAIFAVGLTALAYRLDLHPGLVGGVCGFLFGYRTRGDDRSARPLESLAPFLGPFILAVLAAKTAPQRIPELSPIAWTFCAAYMGTLVVGKAWGGWVASRMTGYPFGVWALNHAQGIALPLLLPWAVPTRLFLGGPSHDVSAFIAAMLVLAGVLPALVVAIYANTRKGSGVQPAVLRDQEATATVEA